MNEGGMNEGGMNRIINNLLAAADCNHSKTTAATVSFIIILILPSSLKNSPTQTAQKI